jgi:myo-inositol-1(or 4)-monophosphatase
MPADLGELLRIAKHAARMAAAVHRRAGRGSLGVSTKGSPIDLVTEFDHEAERELVSPIQTAPPYDTILGEQGTNITGTSGVCWIVDPLEGTTNVVHGYPAHAVALGVEIDGKRGLGVVHDTALNRVYAGIVGEGAHCDDQPIAVRGESVPSRALIGTGFLAHAELRRVQAEVLRSVLPLVRDVRRSGCPSLDLCAVASGMQDGFYESGLGRWDITAGTAIAEAAGAMVVELYSAILPNPLLVVGNAKLLAALVSTLVQAGVATNPPTSAA